MMLRDQIITVIDATPGGLSVEAIAEQVGYPKDLNSLGIIEAFLLFSQEVFQDGHNWKMAAQHSRASRLLAAIEAYADSTGKKIFRLSAALANIPAHEHPTEDELSHILSATNDRYQLLKNAMIKRND